MMPFFTQAYFQLFYFRNLLAWQRIILLDFVKFSLTKTILALTSLKEALANFLFSIMILSFTSLDLNLTKIGLNILLLYFFSWLISALTGFILLIAPIWPLSTLGSIFLSTFIAILLSFSLLSTTGIPRSSTISLQPDLYLV